MKIPHWGFKKWVIQIFTIFLCKGELALNIKKKKTFRFSDYELILLLRLFPKKIMKII